jgi:hypothetical protein
MLLESKRFYIHNKILLNPFIPEYLYQQMYKRSSGGGMDIDGKPILIPTFSKAVRIYNNNKYSEMDNAEGLLAVETNKYILSEYDTEIIYGMEFEYYGRRYSILDTHKEIRFGGIISWKAELRDITGGTNHAH